MKDKFIEYLDGIKNKAVGEKKTDKLKALKKTYNGEISPLMKPKSGNSRPAMYGRDNSFFNIDNSIKSEVISIFVVLL